MQFTFGPFTFDGTTARLTRLIYAIDLAVKDEL